MTPALDLGRLHARQAEAFNSNATEILFGGAAGGGKSHLMRIAAIIWACEIAGLQVYLFRRKSDDLVKNHVEGPTGFRSLLAPWSGKGGLVEVIEGEIRFWNGSKIYLCHCKDPAHRFNYQGAEIHVLLIDELTHFTDVIYRFLRSRLRMTNIDLPEKYFGMFPRILCSSNPGNIGHQFVKSMFIDHAEPMEIQRTGSIEGGLRRQYIPARLTDNPSLDEGYAERLKGLGSPQLIKGMLDGDWDIVEGAFFIEFDRDRHVVEPFKIPQHWLRFRALDWGSASPFSVGWWAVSTEAVTAGGQFIPPNSLIRYREWYGATAPNVGLKLTAGDVARGIRERENDGEEIVYSVADPSIFKEDGGPSIAEEFRKNGVYFTRADNSRIAGWNEMRQRLRGEDGVPLLFTFSTCLDSIRTIPSLSHDERRPEDLDSRDEDHAADEWRYACMSRPWSKPRLEPTMLPTDKIILPPILDLVGQKGHGTRL